MGFGTVSRPHCTLKSHLILVNFYFVSSQFQIKRAHFSLVFPTNVQFCTQIVVLYFFKSLFSSQLFKLTSKIWPTCSISAYPPFSKSRTINWPQRSTKASIYTGKSLYLRIITERSRYRSMGLRSNRICDLFIVWQPNKYLSRYVSNQI